MNIGGELFMNVKIYKTPNKFLEENEKLLLEKEAVSQLLLFNAINNKEKKCNPDLLFGKVSDDTNQAIILFCNVIPYNLIIYGVESEFHKAAITELVHYIIDNKIHMKGLNASKFICDTFCEYYKEINRNSIFTEHLAMDIMELRELLDVNLSDGFCRLATYEDTNIIAEWIVDFAREALSEELKIDEQILRAEQMIEAKRFYVYENTDSEIVSMAAVSRQLIHGICVNYVYTPKEYRGKGYAVSNVYTLSKNMLEHNQFCTLFVDRNNPISNHAYKKIGYKIIEDNYDYRLTINE